MPTKLDSKTIANLKPSAKAFYVNDAHITGLALRVAPKGKKHPRR